MDVPDYAPGLYLTLSDGMIAADGRGGFVVALETRHRVQRYASDGTLVWSVSDPTTLPEVGKTLTVTERGMVRVEPQPRSASIAVSGDWIVHEIVLPPKGTIKELRPGEVIDGSELDLSGIVVPRRYEFIHLDDPTKRFVVKEAIGLEVLGIDDRGGLYAGIGNLGEPTLVRGRFVLPDSERPGAR